MQGLHTWFRTLMLKLASTLYSEIGDLKTKYLTLCLKNPTPQRLRGTWKALSLGDFSHHPIFWVLFICNLGLSAPQPCIWGFSVCSRETRWKNQRLSNYWAECSFFNFMMFYQLWGSQQDFSITLVYGWFSNKVTNKNKFHLLSVVKIIIFYNLAIY